VCGVSTSERRQVSSNSVKRRHAAEAADLLTKEVCVCIRRNARAFFFAK